MEGVIISALTSALAYFGARTLDGTATRLNAIEERLRLSEADIGRYGAMHDHLSADLSSLRTEIRDLRDAIQSLAVALARLSGE